MSLSNIQKWEKALNWKNWTNEVQCSRYVFIKCEEFLLKKNICGNNGLLSHEDLKTTNDPIVLLTQRKYCFNIC